MPQNSGRRAHRVNGYNVLIRKGFSEDRVYAYIWAYLAIINGGNLLRTAGTQMKLLWEDIAADLKFVQIQLAKKPAQECIQTRYKICYRKSI